MFNHLKYNNETYLSHLRFAVGLGLYLLVSGAFFLVHGILPFVQMPKSLCLKRCREEVEEAWNYSQGRLKR